MLSAKNDRLIQESAIIAHHEAGKSNVEDCKGSSLLSSYRSKKHNKVFRYGFWKIGGPALVTKERDTQPKKMIIYLLFENESPDDKSSLRKTGDEQR